MSLFERLRIYLFKKKTPPGQISWENLSPGDHVSLVLKNPEKVGIAGEHRSMTFQRLDSEDIQTRRLVGYVIQTTKVQPGNIQALEFKAVKHLGNQTKLITYFLLREEIDTITLLQKKET